MMIIPITRSLIYQAIAKQMTWLAHPNNPQEDYTTVFIDREDPCMVDEDIFRLAASVVSKHDGHLTRACIDEVGNCGVLAFGFHSTDEAIIFARELDVALSEAGFEDSISGIKIPTAPRVVVWDTKQRIQHEPEAPKKKRMG